MPLAWAWAVEAPSGISAEASAGAAVSAGAGSAAGAASPAPKFAGSKPAELRASVMAVLMAVLVTVAPEMPSTAMEFASTMAAGSFSTATEPMPGVSFCWRMLTS